MAEVIILLKVLLIVTSVFDAAVLFVLIAVGYSVRDITEAAKPKNEQKETVYSIKCIGRQPTECKSEWFTINNEYIVRDDHVFDDGGIKWCVFKYDKLMLEAGGYLFCKATKS